MGEVWLVKQRIEDSYEGFTSDYATISVHKTQEGAKKAAEQRIKDAAVSSISGGEAEDHEASPDDILGAVESYNADLGTQLRQELSKPGAILMDVIFKMLEEHGIPYADTRVSSQELME